MLTIDEINHILTSLQEMPDETETVEFKKAENSFSDSDLGKYFSALSNEANLKRTKQAWLVLGVENSTHQIVGTSYKPSRASLDELKKKLADQPQLVYLKRHCSNHRTKSLLFQTQGP